ncbi:translation initiation factor IF-2 [Trachypithecus francoisi]|uniref:translation initiation factor IF-2 n=1 Tax=Trachypithecus francoisi TaxID=54180 RepID=UPI00141B8FF3|nr:translation initiation factor IF-2 [Trachypithecus francoisi]
MEFFRIAQPSVRDSEPLRHSSQTGTHGAGTGEEDSAKGGKYCSCLGAPVPAGGPERRAGAESGPASPPSQFQFSLGARLRARKWGPHPRAASGPHPTGVPSGAAAGRPRAPTPRQPRGAPRQPRDRSAGPSGGGGVHGGAGGRASPQHPRGLPRRIPEASRGASPRPPAAHPRRLLTCAALRLRSPFTWSSPRPPPARPRRLRELPGGPGSRWAFREPGGGGAGVSPARRPDPSLARAAAAGRCDAGGGFVCARAVLGAPGEARRARAGEDAPLAGQPRLYSRRRPAGGSRRPSARGDPSSWPAAAPSSPAPLLTDGATATTRRRHHRGCSLLLLLMLGPSSSGGERGGGGVRPESDRPRCPIKEPLGSCRPQPLAPGAWAGRQWVGPSSGLSVTVAAGIPGCVRCRVCKRMRGWRRSFKWIWTPQEDLLMV